MADNQNNANNYSAIDNLQAIANIPMQCSDSNPVLSITQRNTPKTGAILTG